MTKDDALGKDLLKQNGLDHTKLSDERHRRLHEMLAAEEKRMLRIRRRTKIVWLVTAVWPAAAIPVGSTGTDGSPAELVPHADGNRSDRDGQNRRSLRSLAARAGSKRSPQPVAVRDPGT